ncbi:MAG: hypothetical protein AB7K36_26005, partial [Chloroflexota bacterium]
VEGPLRADDRLAVEMRGGLCSLSERPMSAVVRDMRRNRQLRWRLTTDLDVSDEAEPIVVDAGQYEINLSPLGAHRTRVTQQLSLVEPADGEIIERPRLHQFVDALNLALQDRVEWYSAHCAPAQQIDGTIRVSSHHGPESQRGQHGAGLLRSMADLLPWRMRAFTRHEHVA